MGVIYILDHLDWLKIMGYNMQHLSPQLMNTNDLPKFPNNLLPNLYPDIPPLSITPVGKHLTKKQQISVAQPVSGYLQRLQKSLSSTKDIPIAQPASVRNEEFVPFGVPTIETKPLPLGEGVVASIKEGVIHINSIPSANPIYRDVFTTVLNASKILNFHTAVHTKEIFYIVKENIHESVEDLNQLNRLSGIVNIETHKPDEESNEKFLNARIHIDNVVLNIRYGATVEKEMDRLLKHAKRHVSKETWKQEKILLRNRYNGFMTSTNWSMSDVENILSHGYSNTYNIVYKQNVNLYPELSKDPYNVYFKKSTISRQRREDMKKNICQNYNWLRTFLCTS